MVPNKSSLIALAVLLSLSFGAQAKGARFKSSGGSRSHAEVSNSNSGGGSHLSSVRPRASASAAGQAAVPAAAAATGSVAMKDKLNAELLAQRAATPPGPPVGLLKAKPAEPAPLAANERRISQPVTVGTPPEVKSGTPIDVSHLVVRDSGKGGQSNAYASAYVNNRGVNCSTYPTRCR